MKEIHYYQCEHCGKKFEDEEECYNHELMETTDSSLFQAYEGDTPIPWPWGGHEYTSINAIRIANKEIWDYLDEYIQAQLGYSSPMECVPTPTEWPVAVFNTDGDIWINVEEEYKMAKDLKEKYLDKHDKM